MICGKCQKNFCLKHRHPEDHECKKPTISTKFYEKLREFISGKKSNRGKKILQEDDKSVEHYNPVTIFIAVFVMVLFIYSMGGF